MRIAHISDTHISEGGAFRLDILEKVIQKINSEPYDIVVHSGDLTQDGFLNDYMTAEKLLEKLDKPYVVIPGNHDYRNVGYQLFEEIVGPPSGTKLGEDYVVIYVASAVPDSEEGRVGRAKYNFLREKLQEYGDKKIKIVTLHHHILPIPHAGRERHVLSNAGDLLDLFLKYDVNLVLGGHRHSPNVYRAENLVIVNSGCISCKKTRGGDINSFNTIEIGEDKVTVITERVDGVQLPKTYDVKRENIFYQFGERVCRIVHMAGTRFTDQQEFQKQKYNNAVRKISSLKPDIIVHCGDVVDEGITKNYRLASEKMSKLKAPVLFTPSGPDLNYLGHHHFPNYLGPLEQRQTIANIYFHGIPSAQYDSEVGIVGQIEIKHMKEDISEREEDFTCVFLHHNVVPIPYIREKGLLEDSGDFLRELCDLNVDLVLTGHSSHPYAVKIENTLVCNANTISGLHHRNPFGNSFNVIDIYEKLIYISEIHSLWGSRRILGMWRRQGKH